MTNKEIAKAWFTAIDKKDFAALKNLAHPGHRFHNPMTPAPAATDDHLGLIKMMTDAITGSHQLDLVLEDGNQVVVRGRFSGKHTGDFNGVAATGNAVTFTFTDILEIKDGKVGAELMEMNPASILAQIGAVPAHA